MKTQVLMAAIVIGVLTTGTYAGARERHDKHHSTKVLHQVYCPIIQKNKIDKSLYIDHDGKRIYVCCKECLEKVAKDPAKYVKHFESAGITLAKVQTTCPVMGGEIKDKNLFIDHDGKRVYFCSGMCPKKFKKDPKKYMKKLHDAGVALDHTPKKEHDEKRGDGGHHGSHH